MIRINQSYLLAFSFLLLLLRNPDKYSGISMAFGRGLQSWLQHISILARVHCDLRQVA